MKQVFIYDKDTLEYVGPYLSQESPLEPGVFIVPEHSTDLPPTLVEGSKSRFVSGAWVLDAVQIPDPYVPTQAEVISSYERSLDLHLDSVARSFRFADRHSLALRAGYPSAYQPLALAFASWMDGCNVQAYQLLQDVLDGKAAIPTVESFIAGLPVFVFPT